MAIAQDAFFIPDNIATGLATGLYRRVGSVVRYATGPNRGQIVKHLKPIELKTADQQSLGAKALQFVSNHKVGVGIASVGMVAISLGFLSYSLWKNHEPKVLTEYRVKLKIYIDAIRNGNMNIEIINDLINASEALKKSKNYNKICIQLTAEEMEVLIGYIHDYTIQLASDNDVNILDKKFDPNNTVVVNLEYYLNAQKKIFEAVA